MLIGCLTWLASFQLLCIIMCTSQPPALPVPSLLNSSKFTPFGVSFSSQLLVLFYLYKTKLRLETCLYFTRDVDVQRCILVYSCVWCWDRIGCVVTQGNTPKSQQRTTHILLLSYFLCLITYVLFTYFLLTLYFSCKQQVGVCL